MGRILNNLKQERRTVTTKKYPTSSLNLFVLVISQKINKLECFGACHIITHGLSYSSNDSILHECRLQLQSKTLIRIVRNKIHPTIKH